MTRTLEVVYTWPSGREEVRYRRPHPGPEADRLVAEVERLARRGDAGGWRSPYHCRVVDRPWEL